MCKYWNSLFSIDYLFVLLVLWALNIWYAGVPSCLTSYIFFPPFIWWLQTLTSSGSKKGDLFVADINTQLKHNNITTDVKVDTSSNVSQLPQFTFGFKDLYYCLAKMKLWNLFVYFPLFKLLWNNLTNYGVEYNSSSWPPSLSMNLALDWRLSSPSRFLIKGLER